MTYRLPLLLTAFTLAAAAGSPLQAGDWPRWRGPNFDGISRETQWLKQWPESGPKQLWKAQVGVGWASMTVANGRLYTMGNTEEVDSVYCFDAITGKPLWEHKYDCSSKDPNGYPGPRVTPTVDGDRVYAVSRQGHLFCLDGASGQVKWAKEYPKDFGAKVPTWGFAGSPLIEGGWVIVETGGPGASVVALDKLTGELAWKAGDDGAAYSSIVPFNQSGQRCLAVLSAAGIVGRRAQDGGELWRYPWKTSYDVNAATPIVKDGKVFISSGYNKGCAQVDFSSGTAKAVWEHKKMRNHVATCILLDGYLYGFDEGNFKCLDWATGEEKWASPKYGKGSVLLAGDRFIVFSDKGRVAVVEPSPAELKEACGFQALTGKDTWAVPVLANGRLYCRAGQDLACFDVSAN